MNKAQLVEALTTRIGDRRTAAAAVDGLVDVIVETVGSGGTVTLTGFGVFEPRRRAARVARNPRTGETVPVPETIVPSFRPGAAFREQIGSSTKAAEGATSAPRRAPRNGSADGGENGAAAPRTRARSTSKAAGGTTRTRRTSSGTAAKTPAAATSTGATAKKTPAASATAKKTTSRGSAKDSTAAPAKRTRRQASTA